MKTEIWQCDTCGKEFEMEVLQDIPGSPRRLRPIDRERCAAHEALHKTALQVFGFIAKLKMAPGIKKEEK